jgi:hypothetical protein
VAIIRFSSVTTAADFSINKELQNQKKLARIFAQKD